MARKTCPCCGYVVPLSAWDELAGMCERCARDRKGE